MKPALANCSYTPTIKLTSIPVAIKTITLKEAPTVKSKIKTLRRIIYDTTNAIKEEKHFKNILIYPLIDCRNLR